MSLLLDALKKTGAGQQKNGKSDSGSLSEMSLEDLPSAPQSPEAAAGGSASPASSAPQVPPSTAPKPTPRSTGENLFAAKKAPARKKFNYTLGIVPTALIIGSVLGIAGGVYVWYEIQPPKAMPRRVAPPAAVAAYTPPAPAPSVVSPLALPPEKPAAREVEAPSKFFSTAPRTQSPIRSNSIKRAPAAEASQGIQIQRKMENDSIYSSVMAAYQAYKSGDYSTAWQKYRDVLLKDPRNRDALLGMAAIAQQQHQDDAALQYYKQVLALDPRDPVAQAGVSAFATEDASTKESRLKQSLSQTPQSAALHFALGNLYTEQSRWGDAQQSYFNAFKIEPSNALFAFSLATSLDHLGQSKVAIQYYRQALQLDTNGNSGFDRGQTEQRMNQLLANGAKSSER